jgi:hypothetical protein
MVVPIARKRMYLSRAVDHEGEILYSESSRSCFTEVSGER